MLWKLSPCVETGIDIIDASIGGKTTENKAAGLLA